MTATRTLFCPPRVLILGAQGQVGYELLGLAQEQGLDVVGLGSAQLDICDGEALERALAEYRPGYVVNATGYTDVQRAEQEAGRCFAVNRDAVGQLAALCQATGAVLIHLSTSHVYEGLEAELVGEQETLAPRGVYATSKLEGERLVQAALKRHLILRTSWIYSRRAEGWLSRLLREAREITDIELEDDQLFNPTSAADVARVIVAMIRQADCGAKAWGVYNYGGGDYASCYGFAEAVIAAARQYEQLCLERLRALSGAEGAPPRKRLLDCRKIRATFGIQQHPWRTELMKVIRQIYIQASEG